MTVKTIYMTGEAGCHNLGDEGMALASAARLRRYFPDAQLVATGIDRLGAVLRHQAEIVPWPLFQHGLSQRYPIKVARRLARKLGAGEDFLDPAARPFERIFAEQYRSRQAFRDAISTMEHTDFVFDMGHGGLNDIFDPFGLCFLYYLAGRLGKPLFISGQSVGPLWRPRSLRMVRNALSHAHTVGLRDRQVSYDVLVKEAGVDPACVRLVEVGDDTLDLTPEEPAADTFTDPLRALLAKGDFFAVQWRGTDYSRMLSATEHLLPLVQAVRHLRERTGLTPVFVPMSWEPAGDVQAAVGMRALIGDAFPFQVVWHALNAPEAKWVLGRAKFGIGLSYHFNVFLLSQGVPCIGLVTNRYYDVKLRGAFAAYAHPGKPSTYGPGMLRDPAFRECVEAALAWDEGQRANSLDAAHELCQQWHTAFQGFIRDHALA